MLGSPSTVLWEEYPQNLSNGLSLSTKTSHVAESQYKSWKNIPVASVLQGLPTPKVQVVHESHLRSNSSQLTASHASIAVFFCEWSFWMEDQLLMPEFDRGLSKF